jgi:hypothetical protein
VAGNIKFAKHKWLGKIDVAVACRWRTRPARIARGRRLPERAALICITPPCSWARREANDAAWRPIPSSPVARLRPIKMRKVELSGPVLTRPASLIRSGS